MKQRQFIFRNLIYSIILLLIQFIVLLSTPTTAKFEYEQKIHFLIPIESGQKQKQEQEQENVNK